MRLPTLLTALLVLVGCCDKDAEWRAEHERFIAKMAQERAARVEANSRLKVGDTFCWTWSDGGPTRRSVVVGIQRERGEALLRLKDTVRWGGVDHLQPDDPAPAFGVEVSRGVWLSDFKQTECWPVEIEGEV